MLAGLMSSAFGWTVCAAGELWWQWACSPEMGEVTITAAGGDPDHHASVFTGSVRTNLTRVSGWRDPVSFAVTAGVIYQICVDGDSDGWFELNLRYSLPPANDRFADRAVIEGRTLISGPAISARPWTWGKRITARLRCGGPGLPRKPVGSK